MKRELICIICPRSCLMQVEINDDKSTVSGNACPKGEVYAINECTNPVRTVTSILRVANREGAMVSVKTDKPISKNDIFACMKKIRETKVCAPLKIGDVLIKDVCSADIIATSDVL